MASISDGLQAFVSYCNQHIRGDEKSEAQTFLTRFFQAFGHEGIKEAGAEFEDRLKKGSSKGKTGFADLVWRSQPGLPGVVIEMKSRGVDLNKHYAQVERYWMRITPNRPRYAMLCNFDEFWIFDFENQVDEPVDRISLAQLPERSGALTFMQVGGMRPVFKNNQVEVTERSARRMGELYQAVYARGQRSGFKDFTEEQLQRFLLQCVLAMFAEDRQLLPTDMFVSLIQDCKDGRGSAYDLLGGLFGEMNRFGTTPAGRYKGVAYFNGGLFSTVDPIDLTREELTFLDLCARDDWSNIRPSIFGNIFEGAIDPAKRHAHGIHFTSEVDIRQIVRPTISDFWEERINGAGTIAELNTLQLELQAYRVLDPACGSGNFLYVAYQELKRIEQLLLGRIVERRKSDTGQMAIGFVTPTQFFGMDTNPFAVQLARVTMMIARKIAIDKHGLDEPALPLDTLDGNIVCQDALFSEWPEVNAIIGNPPFLGRGKTKSLTELDQSYKDNLHKIYLKSSFPRSADLCCYWFRKSHDSAAKRVGLVGSNSITQGNSRKASLDFITKNNGFIYDAVSSQIWSGEAKVHVSIVNWSKEPQDILYLDGVSVASINSSLKSEVDATICKKLKSNLDICFQGVVPQPLERYLISQETALTWLKKDSKNKNVIKRLLSADELTDTVDFTSDRFLIDFNIMKIEEASTYNFPFIFVKSSYLSCPDKNNQDHKNWWQLWRPRMKMKLAISSLKEYIAMPGHSKWFIPVMVPVEYLAYVNSSFVIASDDYYLLGILTSSFHRVWVKAQSSTIKGDTRYTNTTCFETFPFPQNLSKEIIKEIRTATLDLYKHRTEKMEERNWGITKLYNEFFNEPASQLYKLHAKLDQLVMQAYGFKAKDDILEKLLELNLELAQKEKQGETIIGPWAPE
jgi:SAM-dependent methyltransferase